MTKRIMRLPHGAAKGAAVAGAAGVVGGLVRVRPDRALENGVAGATVEGSTGVVAGAFNNKSSGTFSKYGQRCLKDKAKTSTAGIECTYHQRRQVGIPQIFL